MAETIRVELEKRFPGLAKVCGRRPRAAIRLFCIECMGGSLRDARECETKECFLWPFGPAARAAKESRQDAVQRGFGDRHAQEGHSGDTCEGKADGKP